jgi:flagellar protein FlgJ
MTDAIRMEFFLNTAERSVSFPTTDARQRPNETAPDRSKLRAACEEMEALFLNYLMKEMRNTVPEGGLMAGGNAEEIYTSLLDAETAQTISSGRGIGIADMLYEQFLRTQAGNTPIE